MRKDVSAGCSHKILSCLISIKMIIAIDLNKHGDRDRNLCWNVHFQNPEEEGVGHEDINACGSFSSQSAQNRGHALTSTKLFTRSVISL